MLDYSMADRRDGFMMANRPSNSAYPRLQRYPSECRQDIYLHCYILSAFSITNIPFTHFCLIRMVWFGIRQWPDSEPVSLDT